MIQSESLFFAPMEGITDECFRLTVEDLFSDWDYYFTDFLRIPSSGLFPKKILINHLGEEVYQNQSLKNKTIFQVLFSEKSETIDSIKQIEDLGINWIDLNFGCPSNTVCKNGGGSSWLRNLERLFEIVLKIRQNYSGTISVKTRLGFFDTQEFECLIRGLNQFPLKMITVHGRTREQMYKEPAQWEFIKKAVEYSHIPIIGNGDVWQSNDIQQMFQITNCFGVMVARGALQTPWMASLYKNQNQKETSITRLKNINDFYDQYSKRLILKRVSDDGIIKQLKSLSRYMFQPLPHGEALRRRLLHQQTYEHFMRELKNIKNETEQSPHVLKQNVLDYKSPESCLV